jgi:8-oxo-dGTP pyrophosphatase MutT (NUDIX family)
VSVKGVVLRRGRVVLLRNERGEWELPGGKLELHESPVSCVVRELAEELGLVVRAERPLDPWIYTIAPGVHVLILTYGCVEIRENAAKLSSEHKDFEWFSLEDLDFLDMPGGYKTSIRQWASAYSDGE